MALRTISALFLTMVSLPAFAAADLTTTHTMPSSTLVYASGSYSVTVSNIGNRDAYDTKVALAKREGLLVGISAGANVHVALGLARELGEGSTVVTVLCDTGERYFSLDEYFRD